MGHALGAVRLHRCGVGILPCGVGFQPATNAARMEGSKDGSQDGRLYKEAGAEAPAWGSIQVDGYCGRTVVGSDVRLSRTEP